MNKYDLVKKIEDFAPLDTQETWDCSGWIVETDSCEINKVMLALTVTDDVYAQAKEKNCDIIISHHPLFFIPLKFSDINIYSAHTNMDKAVGGTTDTLINKLGLKIDYNVGDFVRVVTLNHCISVLDFKEKLRKISPNLRFVNNQNQKNIKTIAFCAGSGSEFINTVNVDAFVTGDLKYHCAVESNKVIFDIGHFESEIFVLEVFKQILGIEVIIADEKTPFIN